MENEIQKEIFDHLKALLTIYETKLKKTKDLAGQYDLHTRKPIEMLGKTYPNLCFANIAIQKNYVSLYFFPAYTHPAEFENISDLLKKLKKGKSCFNLKKWDEQTKNELSALIKQGFELYNRKGLI
jgi:hypothetical protein